MNTLPLVFTPSGCWLAQKSSFIFKCQSFPFIVPAKMLSCCFEFSGQICSLTPPNVLVNTDRKAFCWEPSDVWQKCRRQCFFLSVKVKLYFPAVVEDKTLPCSLLLQFSKDQCLCCKRCYNHRITTLTEVSHLLLEQGGLSAAPARAVSAVKNMNLPEIPRNINIGDINIKVPSLSPFWTAPSPPGWSLQGCWATEVSASL